MKPIEGSVVLVTGAASGIGRETAFAFAERGARLELVDLHREGLAHTERLARGLGAEVHSHVVDVTDAAAMNRLAERIHARVSAVDVLVNNAGIGAAGAFLDTTLATWRKTFDVNVFGVVHGCFAFLPAMVRRGGGHVVNVASAAGLVAMADMPVYASSKFAVVGFSASLRSDLARHGIGVSCICPGIIDTPIVERTRYEGAAFAAEGTRERIERLYRRRRYTPRKVADAILASVEDDAGLVPVSPESWALWLGERIAPGLLPRLGAAMNVFGPRQA